MILGEKKKPEQNSIFNIHIIGHGEEKENITRKRPTTPQEKEILMTTTVLVIMKSDIL